VARRGEMENLYRALIGYEEGRWLLGKLRHKCEYNIKRDFKEII
jgi:hypothetical protein